MPLTLSTKMIGTALGVAGGLLALGTNVFGCIQFEGVACFDGNGSGSSPRRLVAGNTFHGACSDTGDTVKVAKGAQSVTITVRTKTSSDCLPTINVALPTGTYNVMWKRGATTDACLDPYTTGGTVMGAMAITSGSGGPGAYQWHKSTADIYHICIGLQNPATNGHHGFGTYVTAV